MLFSSTLLLGAFALLSNGLVSSPYQKELISDDTPAERKWDFEWPFSGISTFGHLPHEKCLSKPREPFDFAVVGIPFDTAVSYRPGARFGPRSIRAASSRHLPSRGFNPQAGVNPYRSWARILDCGDVPVTPFDNALAVKQMTEALTELGSHPVSPRSNHSHPRLILLGGDHSISLPALRALNKVHGQPVAVVHFDAHLDTLHPSSYPSYWPSTQSDFTHGSMLWQAYLEGLVKADSSVHVGLRPRLTGTGLEDYAIDDAQGYLRVSTEEIDEIGTRGIVQKIIDRVGLTTPVYLSIDIDILDPAFAPGTGAPETGGWTTRELSKIIRDLRNVTIVGADIVEVAPAYDGPGEITSFAAAQLAYEILTNWVLNPGAKSSDVPGPEATKTEL